MTKYLEDMTPAEKLDIIRQHGGDVEHMLDILLSLQRMSRRSCLDMSTVELAAEALSVPRTHVLDVIGFYSMLTLAPTARYALEICVGNPCKLCHNGFLVEELKKQLGIDPFEVTDDGMFTVSFMGCVGACDIGPVIRVGDTVYGHLNSEKIRELILELRNRK